MSHAHAAHPHDKCLYCRLATELRKAATSDLLDDPAIRAVLAAVDMAALKTGGSIQLWSV